MVVPRLPTGLSDPVNYVCSCPARETKDGGLVLLFYRYFSNTPSLPPSIDITQARVQELAAFHKSLTQTLCLTGKIRIAAEGFNVTVAGLTSSIHEYESALLSHWSLAGLSLTSPAEQKAFFKPSPGCACVFAPATEAAVQICAEITPLGIEGYTPRNWDSVEELVPREFHRRCVQGAERVRLMDLRNHYESRVGFFVDGRGNRALLPQIRRFSQWPRFWTGAETGVGRGGGRIEGRDEDREEQILTYCTGGIRCEKATRWMAERETERREGGSGRRICTLKGGIAAYLDWVDGEVAQGRMVVEDSLFKGRNYVFDARGAVGLNTSTHPVAKCHVCGKDEDRLSKCKSQGCHLVLVVCADCEREDPRCCASCSELTSEGTKGMCICEREREFSLWGVEDVKEKRTQGWRKAKAKAKEKEKAKANPINVNTTSEV